LQVPHNSPRPLIFCPSYCCTEISCTTRLLREPCGLSLARFKRQTFSHPGAHHDFSTVEMLSPFFLGNGVHNIRRSCSSVSRLCGTTLPRLVPKTSIILAQPRVFTGSTSQGRPGCGGTTCCRKTDGKDGLGLGHRGLWMLGAAYHLASVPISPVTPRPRNEIWVRCLEGLLSLVSCLTRSTVFTRGWP
jgi:hypothetical protein